MLGYAKALVMDEEENKQFEWLKSVRAGHRWVATKLVLKTFNEELEDPEIYEAWCSSLMESIEGKVKTLAILDEKILDQIDVDLIENEIEESSEVTSRLFNARNVLRLFITKKFTNQQACKHSNNINNGGHPNNDDDVTDVNDGNETDSDDASTSTNATTPMVSTSNTSSTTIKNAKMPMAVMSSATSLPTTAVVTSKPP